MLERVGGFMIAVGEIVRAHHERWDGKGYPDGLAADQIPLEARIVGCCDAWNAMRTDRPYRNALSYAMAVAQIRQNCGTQFDPTVVAALLATVAEPAGDTVAAEVIPAPAQAAVLTTPAGTPPSPSTSSEAVPPLVPAA